MTIRHAPTDAIEDEPMYAWVLALHIISFTVWFAALFYLPRLFIYHSHALRQDDGQGSTRFQVMERKLYRAIMNPGMILTLIFGIWLVALDFQGYLTAGWFYVKAVLVVLLIGFHHICMAHMKRFAAGTNRRGGTYYRIFGIVPALLLIAIVILSVVQPF
ncbi:protoporphyrinogen oxidase HemJ [Kushneria sp. AK178]